MSTESGTAILENEILRVELDPVYPVIRRTLHRPSGTVVEGLAAGCVPWLAINGQIIPCVACEIDADGSGSYRMAVPQEKLTLTVAFALEGSEVIFRLVEVDESAGGQLKTLHLDAPFAVAPAHWEYYRRRHVQNPWDTYLAKGIWRHHTDTGTVGAAIPDRATEALTFACVWNDQVCISARASFCVKPVELHFEEVEGVEARASRATLGMGTYHHRVGEKMMEPLEFRVAFLEDLNGDGQPDHNDAALWFRQSLPEAKPLYRDSYIYKIDVAFRDQFVSTFDQCLEVIKRVELVSDGMPQVIYLVGWQYDGHDTGYPSLNQVNERAGGKEALARLIGEAKQHNAVVSCHINVDDAYPEHPGWDPEIICRNPDGSLAQWEVWSGHQSYHISHTKDVRSGKVFRRLDEFLALVPVEQTIHFDACRFTNESWEPGGEHIGPVEELELGLKPILEYLRSKGIDPTTEILQDGPGYLSHLFGFSWYQILPPLLQFGRTIGSGEGYAATVPMAAAIGSSAGNDFGYETPFEEIADHIYLATRLYHLYLTRELMECRYDQQARKHHMRFGEDGLVEIDARAGTMRVQWGDIEVARGDERFLPDGPERIYAYSKGGGEQSWTLPADWAGGGIEAHTITPEGVVPGPEFSVEGRTIKFQAEPQRPIRLTKTS